MAAESGMPGWILILAYSLHMLATVIWIGGISFQAILLIPLTVSGSKPHSISPFNERLFRRFQPLAWLSLAILTVTGLMQMTSNPSYAGFLNFTSRWSVAILLKHIAIIGMVALLAYQSWVIYPHWSREKLRSTHNADGLNASEANIIQQDNRLVRIHLLLSILILFLTAIARTS